MFHFSVFWAELCFMWCLWVPNSFINYFVLDVFLMIIIGLRLMFCDPDLLIILMFSSYRCFPATSYQFLIGRPRTNDELKLENSDVASLIDSFLSASKHKCVSLNVSFSQENRIKKMKHHHLFTWTLGSKNKMCVGQRWRCYWRHKHMMNVWKQSSAPQV